MNSIQQQLIIEELQGYQRIVGRIRLLENYTGTTGVRLSAFAQDDDLQELHKQLRSLPSSSYLTKHEQLLAQTADSYLDKHPVGIKAQYHEVTSHVGDTPEDVTLLRELGRKMEKVIEARGGGRTDGYSDIINRLSELQDLKREKERIDNVLDTLRGYKPQYEQLLQLHFIQQMTVQEVMDELGISRTIFYEWRKKSLAEYGYLAG